MRRTGAWAVREGAGIIHPPPPGPPSAASDVAPAAAAAATRTFDPIVLGEVQGRVRRSGGGSGGGGSGGGGSGGGGEAGGENPAEGRVAVGEECDAEASDEEALLVALKTAEVGRAVGWVRGLFVRAKIDRAVCFNLPTHTYEGGEYWCLGSGETDMKTKKAGGFAHDVERGDRTNQLTNQRRKTDLCGRKTWLAYPSRTLSLSPPDISAVHERCFV